MLGQSAAFGVDILHNLDSLKESLRLASTGTYNWQDIDISQFQGRWTLANNWHIERTLETMSDVRKHITSNTACARSHWYTEYTMIWLAEMALKVMSYLLVYQTLFKTVWQAGCQYVNWCIDKPSKMTFDPINSGTLRHNAQHHFDQSGDLLCIAGNAWCNVLFLIILSKHFTSFQVLRWYIN